MVYYIKAMAKGLTTKVALPLALSASMVSSALAATEFSVVSTVDKNKTATGFGISADEELLVGITMKATAGEKITAIEGTVQLPEGLALVEGSFNNELPTDEFNATLDNLGHNKYRLLVFSPAMAAISGETLVTFRVKANRNLVNGSDIEIDLTDVITTDNENVAPATQTTVVTRQYDLPGTNEVPAIAGFELNPGQEYTIEVPFNNDAEIHGMKSTIELPAGLTLVIPDAGITKAFERGDRIASVAITGGENADGTYNVVIGTGKFEGNSGTLFTFKVKAGGDDVWNNPDPSEIKITTFELSDKYGTAHDVLNIQNIEVTNPNAVNYKALDEALKAIEEAYQNYVDATEGNAEGDADYLKYASQVTAEKTAADDAVAKLRTDLEAAKAAGTLGTSPLTIAEPAEVPALKAAVAAAKQANDEAYAANSADVQKIEEALAKYEAEDADYLKYASQVETEKDAAEAAVAALKAAVEDGNTAGTLATNPVDTKEPAAVPALKAAVAAAKQANDDAYTANTADVQKIEEELAKYEAEDADYLKYASQVETEKDAAEAAVAALKAAVEAGNEAGTLATSPVDTTEPAEVQALKDAVAAAKQANDDAYAADDAAVKDIEDALAAYEATDDYKLYADQVEAETTAAEAAVEALRKAVEDGNEAGTLATEPVDTTEPAAVQDLKDAVAAAKQANDDAYSDRLAEVSDLNFAVADIVVDANVADDQAVKDAIKAAAEAVEAFSDAVEAANLAGKTAVNAADLDALKAAADQAVADAQGVADDQAATYNANAAALEALNDAIENLQDELDAAQDALDNYGNEDFADQTKVNDLQERIDAVQEQIDKLKSDIAADGDDAEDKRNLADPDKVQEYIDAINEQLDLISKTEVDPATGETEETGIAKEISDLQEDYDLHHQLGDVNNDTEVDITDYFWIIDYYLERETPASAEDKARADLNGDGKIDLVDATRMVNIIQNQAVSAARSIADVNETLTVTTTTLANGVRRYALNLNSQANYVAAQMDIVLPEGMTLVGESLTERTAKHQLMSADVQSGAHRVALTSTTNRLFQGSEGAVLYFDVMGEGELEFQNVMFIDEAANGQQLNVVAGEATGINGIAAETSLKDTIYNMGGRVVNALKKGINIIRRADGTTEKVMVK